jgi:hypothetical protein
MEVAVCTISKVEAVTFSGLGMHEIDIFDNNKN